MDLFLYLGICIWIWASKHTAMWHVSGYIPMRRVSLQEAGDIMMVPAISVASRLIQEEKHALFLCPCMPIIHPRNLWVRGSNLTGGHNRLSCPCSADTALKSLPYLTLHAYVCRLVSRFTTGTQNYCQPD